MIARTLNGKFTVSFCLGIDDATLTGAPRKMLLGSWERLREPDSVIIEKAGYALLFPDATTCHYSWVSRWMFSSTLPRCKLPWLVR